MPPDPAWPLRARQRETHARIAYLERFRTALWYCDMVWAQVSSADLPHAPARLR
jgi:hypothetical protein